MQGLALSLCLQTLAGTAVHVYDEPIARLDSRIFGAFLEKAAGSETGPDAVTDENGQLLPGILETLRQYSIPLIRYPGGFIPISLRGNYSGIL